MGWAQGDGADRQEVNRLKIIQGQIMRERETNEYFSHFTSLLTQGQLAVNHPLSRVGQLLPPPTFLKSSPESIPVVNKKCQGLKNSYFPNFGALIPNLTIIFKFMAPILQCCQFCGFLVENYIFENISKFWKKIKLFFFNLERQ